MKKVLTLLTLSIVVALIFLYSTVWYARPYSAKVVDKEGRPIPGVVVLVAWTIKRFGTYPMIFKETTSDREGNFLIPGWVALSPASFGYLLNSPSIYLVHHGYLPLSDYSAGNSNALNATPQLPEKYVMTSLDEEAKQADRQYLEYFVDGACANLVLLLNRSFLNDAKKFKRELMESFKELPSQYSKKQYREYSCIF